MILQLIAKVASEAGQGAGNTAIYAAGLGQNNNVVRYSSLAGRNACITSATISTTVRRRNVLQLTGATLATAIAGCVASDGDGGSPAGDTSGEGDGLIEFDDPEDLLLEPELLPGSGWEVGEREEADILDVERSFVREFEDGEEVDGEEGNNWLVVSAVGGRDGTDAATDLYGELETDFVDSVGEARVMDLELASEAVVAGYDGFTSVLFRDANCVSAVSFTDCVSLSGPCFSDISRVEALARTQRESWRAPDEDPNGGEEDEAEQDDGEEDEAGEDGNGDDEGDETDPQTDDELTFVGEGTRATESVGLERGFLAAEYEHEGTNNFIVNLVDTAGEEPDYLLVNDIGSVAGRTAEGIDGGEYVLDVEADGAWRIELAQPRPTEGDAEELPVTVEGDGNDYAGPFLFDGLVRATAQYDGPSNFIVSMLDENGALEASLFNEIGNFEGETAFTRTGLGWLTVVADGEWTIDLEHD